MACCGRGKPRKRRTMVHNSKLCPKCGWMLNSAHKYNAAKQAMVVYQVCSNKQCKFRKNTT